MSSNLGIDNHENEYAFRILSNGECRGYATVAEGQIRDEESLTLQQVADNVARKLREKGEDLNDCTIRVAPLLKGEVMKIASEPVKKDVLDLMREQERADASHPIHLMNSLIEGTDGGGFLPKQ